MAQEVRTASALTDHPAPWLRGALALAERHVNAERRALGRPVRVLDPFAGIGRIHDLPARMADTIGVELEPEWAACRSRTIVGDATALPFGDASFDAVITSPCYGNRVSDHHEARDSCYVCKGTGVGDVACGVAPMFCSECGRADCICGALPLAMKEHNTTCTICAPARCRVCGGNGLTRRHTYRHTLGRLPRAGSAAVMQWGEPYRELHRRAIAEFVRVLPSGLVLVNMKNHIRGGQEQHVVAWWIKALGEAGFRIESAATIKARGTRHGANADARVPNEVLIAGRL